MTTRTHQRIAGEDRSDGALSLFKNRQIKLLSYFARTSCHWQAEIAPEPARQARGERHRLLHLAGVKPSTDGTVVPTPADYSSPIRYPAIRPRLGGTKCNSIS